MTIAKGVTLGPYEMVARIGEGGMGEVWRARDSRIGRDVAIKVLAESFTAGDQRLWRFEQEARAAGALNHPGLVTIFDVGTTNGSPYIVMELLEGQTLREAIGDPAPVPLPLRKAIDWAMQIASALAVAHDKGIIHRDLKPENIFITSEGRVKILDFGLAKLAETANGSDDSVKKPNRHLTSAGIVVGTPGYMSPEQVRAHPLDHRTDIFSFGSVLYEMLTGKPAFECNSAIETMHAILNVEPPALTTLDPKIPAALDAIVFHCLEKNPRDRFQSARDLAFQLRMLPEMQQTLSDIRALPPLPGPADKRRQLSIATWSAIAATLLALGAGGFALYRAGAVTPQAGPRSFKQLTFADGVELFPTLAPDGKSFAYVSSQSGNRDIYVQRVDGRTAINLTADSPDDDSEPAFSPDGGQIAFRSEREGGGIFVMLVTGESVRRLTIDNGHNPSWSPDGTRIVYSTAATELQPNIRSNDGEMWIVDARTGVKRPLVRGGFAGFSRDADAVQPSWSPHGNRIAYWSVHRGTREISTVDPNAQNPKDTVVKVVSDAGLLWNPVWSPDGKYLYYGSDRDGTLNLWRVPMEEESGKPAGSPEALALPGTISGNFSFSHQGELAFTTVTRSYRLLSVPLDPPAAATGPRPLLGGSQEFVSFDLSPDGSTIAYTTGGVQEDLFVVNADGTRTRQLTNDAARDRGVTWSPDGKTLFFYSNRDGGYQVWSIRADGSGLTRVTDPGILGRAGRTNAYTTQPSPDGRTLAVDTTDATHVLIHLDRPPASRAERIADLGNRGIPRWSPDGQRIAGASDKGITLYSVPAKRLETLLPHGSWPQWFPDGKRLLFFDDQRIGVLDLASRRESTHPWTPLPGVRLDHTSTLSRDGSTLYVRQNLEQADIWLMRIEKGGR